MDFIVGEGVLHSQLAQHYALRTFETTGDLAGEVQTDVAAGFAFHLDGKVFATITGRTFHQAATSFDSSTSRSDGLIE